jgi:tetraacyldisaccharide 4'-kinase
MNFTGLLLFPITVIYGFIVYLRNKLFDFGILKSRKFNFPIISVGNLSMGGTGKTPQIEYLIRLLKKDFRIATLSRGYGRKSKGFMLVDEKSNSIIAGDEPMQYRTKFPEITVALDEKRVNGVNRIFNEKPETEVILLDDAFQHRYIKSGLSILLTDFYKPFSHDYIFPSGTLREARNNMQRANIIVVTKSPRILSPITRKSMEEEMKIKSFQKVYYSYIEYGKLIPLNAYSEKLNYCKISTILMIAGIANPYPLEEQLKTMADNVESIIFKDHFQFEQNDAIKIKKSFDAIFSKNKIIVTTEKDAMRIKDTDLLKNFVDLPFFYLPIEVRFHKNDKEKFDKQIIDYVRKNKPNH